MIHLPFTGNIAAQRKITTVHRIDVAENAADPGAAARVQLKDGSSTGVLYCDVRLAAAESKHITFTPPLFFPNGVYGQVSAGTVRGSITGE